MKTLTLLALLTVATMLLGCSSDPCGSCAGDFQANCCGWEFYKACDLIEGKQECCDVDPCNPCPQPCAPRRVVVEEIEVRELPDPAPVEMPVPEAPDATDAPAAPIADFGFPPAGR